MAEIGTPLSSSATKVLFCGAGELGKEVIIEMIRLGVEVIAVDRYANAPGMQVAHRSHVINMLDGARKLKLLQRIRSWNLKRKATTSSRPRRLRSSR